MRVPDEILKGVVFLGCDTCEEGRTCYKLVETAFLVGVPRRRRTGFHCYMVASRHGLINNLKGRPFGVRINTKDGVSRDHMYPAAPRWWAHPSDASVAVAVRPADLLQEGDDFAWVPAEWLLTEQLISDRNIGPGDEVFMTGLCSKMERIAQNIPIIRTGNVAMMPPPGERVARAVIGDWKGEIEAYLMEARSTGGISGSPVFVHETIVKGNVSVTTAIGGRRTIDLLHHGDFYLLGLAHGHWDVLPKDKNETRFKVAAGNPEAVNLGIAVVVPSVKILEVLNHPDLARMREEYEETEAAEDLVTSDKDKLSG